MIFKLQKEFLKLAAIHLQSRLNMIHGDKAVIGRPSEFSGALLGMEDSRREMQLIIQELSSLLA